MHQISDVAKRLGVSRSTLLYYEKIGLICAKRRDNNYRRYCEKDIEKLIFILQLKDAGLSLQESLEAFEQKLRPNLLREKLLQLDKDIAKKQRARELLAALAGQQSLRDFHIQSETAAPKAHQEWLQSQGLNNKDRQRLRWLSKDINQHESYMSEFNHIFNSLERWAPGSVNETLAALKLIPENIKSILEIGSGHGIATLPLAQHSSATITAIDNEASALDYLASQIANNKQQDKIQLLNADMAELPFKEERFDLIWSEGSAYIMGFENALRYWKGFLNPGAFIVISELIWSTDTPSEKAREYWGQNYPDMQDRATRLAQAEQLGFKLIDDFSLSDQAWNNYYQPLKAAIDKSRNKLGQSEVLNDIDEEIAIAETRNNEFDYQFFIFQL
ncbi:MerR family transcriptional regulator [uncultured Pseudoteredinibacter sp.]|uniref:MerR family transcriptional regulator n=1 Tax=uncultured Pseudoteredinibacter sp. TaxID=1641701 RepID=UPI00263341E6|nr:MerR family transcriptional regulator [uncultured Pseudoteredinibacter sp.]